VTDAEPDLGRQEGRFDPPDADGFRRLRSEHDRFHHVYGDVRVRREGARGRVRVATGLHHSNPLDALHGGFLMAFADIALFLGPAILGRLRAGPAVTMHCATTFILPGRVGIDLDALVEVTGETGRTLFVRGLLEQEAQTIASFEGTMRKISPR